MSVARNGNSMTVTVCSTVPFAPKFGTSRKDQDYCRWSMESLGARRDDGTWHNMFVNAVSFSQHVIELMHHVTAKQTRITIVGNLALNWYRPKDGKPNVSMTVWVDDAWYGEPDAKPANAQPAPVPAAAATEPPFNQEPLDEVPF